MGSGSLDEIVHAFNDESGKMFLNGRVIQVISR